MPELSGPHIEPGDLAEVYSRTVTDIGSLGFDDEGNIYKFLRGVASTVQYAWVTYDETGDTALLAANAKGPVAVAQGAIVNARYGWYCIHGVTSGRTRSGLGDNVAVLGRSVTDGYVNQTPASGDAIYGAISRSSLAAGNTQTTSTFQINFPFVDDQASAH